MCGECLSPSVVVLLVVGYVRVSFIFGFILFVRIFQFVYQSVCLKLKCFVLCRMTVHWKQCTFNSDVSWMSLPWRQTHRTLFRLHADFIQRRNDSVCHCRFQCYVLKFWLFNFHCAVLVADSEQCPFVEANGQWNLCYSSSFPSRFYEDSIDEVCQ